MVVTGQEEEGSIMNEEDFKREMKEQQDELEFWYDDVPESPIEIDYVNQD